MFCEAWNKRKVSSENAENVVNPPQIPTIKKQRNERDDT